MSFINLFRFDLKDMYGLLHDHYYKTRAQTLNNNNNILLWKMSI